MTVIKQKLKKVQKLMQYNTYNIYLFSECIQKRLFFNFEQNFW